MLDTVRRQLLRDAADACDDVGEELAAALNRDVAVERGHVLVDGGGAQTDSRGHLFLAVDLDQARERLLAREVLRRSFEAAFLGTNAP